MRIPVRALAVAASFVLGCTAPAPDGRAPQRLTPKTFGSDPAAGALFDRDTSTFLELTAPRELVVTFEADVELRAVKAFAAQPVDVTIGEETLEFVAAGGWE